MRSTIFLAPLLSAALFACGPKDPPASCFLGDPAQPAEIELVYRSADGSMMPLSDMGSVPLIQPPQGGKVVFIGVRAKNVDGCPLNIRTALLEPCTGDVIALERRPVTMVPKPDGWLEPLQPMELSNYSNLPACPRADLTRDVHGEPYMLLVSIEDKDGRKVEKDVMIVPSCAEPGLLDQCRCECSQSYTLGATCDPARDAGMPGVCPGDGGVIGSDAGGAADAG